MLWKLGKLDIFNKTLGFAITDFYSDFSNVIGNNDNKNDSNDKKNDTIYSHKGFEFSELNSNILTQLFQPLNEKFPELMFLSFHGISFSKNNSIHSFLNKFKKLKIIEFSYCNFDS